MRPARNGRLLLSPGKVPWRKRGSAGSLARTATNRRAEGVDSRSKTSNANAITRVSSNFFRDIVETGYSTNERLGNERRRGNETSWKEMEQKESLKHHGATVMNRDYAVKLSTELISPCDF